MNSKKLFQIFKSSKKLINTDITYINKNAKLLNNIDLGNMYEKIYDTVSPLLYDQKMFSDNTIRNFLKIKEIEPSYSHNGFATTHIYIIRGYVQDSPDFDWFFDFNSNKDDEGYQGSLRGHRIPYHSLIVIDSHDESDAFSEWTARDYDHLATSKNFLTFLTRMQKLLNKFNPKMTKLEQHFQKLVKDNNAKETNYVGIGYNATL